MKNHALRLLLGMAAYLLVTSSALALDCVTQSGNVVQFTTQSCPFGLRPKPEPEPAPIQADVPPERPAPPKPVVPRTPTAAASAAAPISPPSAKPAATQKAAETPPTPAAPPPATKPVAEQEPPRPPADPRTALRNRLAARISTESIGQLATGADTDIVLFTNEQPMAPHAARRVNDTVYFRGNAMNVCGLGGILAMEDIAFAQYAATKMQEANPGIALNANPPWSLACSDFSGNNQTDVFAMLRSEFLSNPESQDQVIMAMMAKQIRYFGVIGHDEFDQKLARRDDEMTRLQEKLEFGSLDALGLLSVPNRNDLICAVEPADTEFVSRVAQEIGRDLLFDKRPGNPPSVRVAPVDDVFLDTKADRCGFVFGDGALLKRLLDAFKRDGYLLRLSPSVVWHDRANQIQEALSNERKAAPPPKAQP